MATYLLQLQCDYQYDLKERRYGGMGGLSAGYTRLKLPRLRIDPMAVSVCVCAVLRVPVQLSPHLHITRENQQTT